MTLPRLDPADVRAAVEVALAEDVGKGDITTQAIIPSGARLRAIIVARQPIVVAGVPVAVEVFRRIDRESEIEIEAPDGSKVDSGAIIARLDGKASAILPAERTALNFLQTLSGIATLTRKFVDRIEGTGAVLLDTRKTIPGLRALSKYATAVGGATNHRMRLDDGVLIKDNHVAVAGGVAEAVRRAKAKGLKNVEIECDTVDQVRQALAAGADRLLLDNMSLAMLREAVDVTAGRVPLEASGGVTLETIRAIAETGVDFVSVGAITMSAPSVDIGLDLAND
ncbi:MAG TPA: carboxylating nicotinate-nucleotide diphosphorylase [Rhodospirillales bacterium]